MELTREPVGWLQTRRRGADGIIAIVGCPRAAACGVDGLTVAVGSWPGRTNGRGTVLRAHALGERMPRHGVFGMSAAGRSRHKPEKGGFSF